MGTYRNISLTFWSDAKVNNNFSAWDKYLYLYLLTNPKTTICGCYEVSRKQMVLDTGLTDQEIQETLRRLQDIHHVIAFCQETREVLIYNWGKYNWSRSEKVAAAVRTVAMHIKCASFRDYILEAVDNRLESGGGKEERTKEENSKQKSDTVSSKQKSDTVSVTDVSIGYAYPMDRVSEAEEKDGKNEDFERFWNVYPRKIGKAKAKEAFRQTKEPMDKLIRAVEAQKKGRDWTKENGKYIPAPAKWLEEERWKDDVSAAASEGFAPGPHELEAIRRMMERHKKEEV